MMGKLGLRVSRLEIGNQPKSRYITLVGPEQGNTAAMLATCGVIATAADTIVRVRKPREDTPVLVRVSERSSH
jgi:hypothetical protein